MSGYMSLLQCGRARFFPASSGSRTEQIIFFLSFRAIARNLQPLKQEISPVGRNDTACMRSFCKRLTLHQNYGVGVNREAVQLRATRNDLAYRSSSNRVDSCQSLLLIQHCPEERCHRVLAQRFHGKANPFGFCLLFADQGAVTGTEDNRHVRTNF